MTRSRAKQQPDEYTTIPAQLKIIKVLVEELLSASGNTRALDAAAAAELDEEDEGGEDSEWEDDEGGGFLDLGTGMTKAQLMGFGADGELDGAAAFAAARGRDDETQGYLLEFFRRQAQLPEFGEVFGRLTVGEQEKLRGMSQP